MYQTKVTIQIASTNAKAGICHSQTAPTSSTNIGGAISMVLRRRCAFTKSGRAAIRNRGS
jgi:hypothetical protein